MADQITFVHIPKTGGTSFIGTDGINYVSHRTGAIACARYPETRVLFAVIRNPVDRFISAYNYVGMEKSHWHEAGTKTEHPDYATVKTHSIDLLITKLFFSEIRRKVFGSKVKGFLNGLHWNRQHSYLVRPRGVRLFVVDQARMSFSLDELKKIIPGIPVIREVKNKSFKSVSAVGLWSWLALRILYYKDFTLYKRVEQSDCGWIEL